MKSLFTFGDIKQQNKQTMKEKTVTVNGVKVDVYYEMDGNECLIHDLAFYEGRGNVSNDEIAMQVEILEAEEAYERMEGDTCPDVDDIVSERRM